MSDSPALVHGLPADPGPLLDLLVRGWPERERSLQRQLLESALDGNSRETFVCWRAVRGEQLVGAALAQQLAGRTAAVYPPQTADGEGSALAVDLLRALEESLRSSGIALAQSLLALDQTEDEARLAAAGFENAATLLYMACDATVFRALPAAGDLVCDRLTPENEPVLRNVIEASYEGTLDCPLLNGLRTTPDVLAGYRAVGIYRPELWLLAQCGGQSIGCLLLADHPEAGNLEVVYLGVVRSARGRGFGRVLIHQALDLARKECRERVVLAVDAANAPAIRLYEAAGFFGFDQRVVMIRRVG